MDESAFCVDVYQNEYLPEGAREVSAVLTVTCAVDLAQKDDIAAAEIIILDCSGSMARRGQIAAAREATVAAVDAIGDGVAFAVIAGTQTARVVFPADDGLAVASAQSRDLARQAVAGLRARGGTRIGEWLRLAHQLFASRSAGLRHAILLTDGQNGESPQRLDQALSVCAGVFSCDCRGVGTRWKVAELRKIAAALDGTVDIVADPAGLAADFTAMMHSSMSKQVAEVALRVWTPGHADIQFVRQVTPAIEDLTGRRVPAGPQTGHYPVGAWGAGESRDYHLRVRVRPGAVGQEMLAARVSVVTGSPSGPRVHGQGLVRAIWTADEVLSAPISPHVAHYTGQAELAQAIQDGLQARKRGDEQTATARLGRAVALAAQSGNQDTVKLLAKVVDVVDAATGTVRLRGKVADADEMALDTRSVRTIRTRK
jgi:von Willebrand factor type A C-terminal domain/von Willebrand factor type A domain